MQTLPDGILPLLVFRLDSRWLPWLPRGENSMTLCTR
jgi:hypothetical protein